MLNAQVLKKQGFSLVELSIVLVILGLLVGGVLSGQSLIRAAELRKYITLQDRYRTALLSFRDKYFALPGDMTNATAFWGAKSATNCLNNAGAAVNTATGTCDGNGDGNIYYQASRMTKPTGFGNSFRARDWWRVRMPTFVVQISKATLRL